jgi:hypothetical protein
MKHVFCQGPKLRKSLIAFLMLQLALFLTISESQAQGWGFSYTLVLNGPCASYASIANAISGTIPSSMPNKSTCESLRKILTDFHYSVETSEGLCEEYFQCTPCTGSDNSSGTFESEFGAGNISIDGILQGTAFFSPHESKEVEGWINDYMVRLKSMGISVSDINTTSIQNIPLTGDSYIDNYYMKQAMGFESYVGSNAFNNLLKRPESTDSETGNAPKAPEPKPVNATTQSAAEEGIGTTVQLLTSYEEQKKRDDWNEEHGFNNTYQVGSDNSIDASGSGKAVMSLKDAVLTEFLDGNIIGKTGLNAIEGSLSAANDALNTLASRDNAGAEELGNNLLGGKVAINVVKKTTKEGITEAITGGLTGPLLGTVKGAGVVTSIITSSSSIWDRMHGKN